MHSVADLKHSLQEHKRTAAGQNGRKFMPNGVLKEILTSKTLPDILSDSALQIEAYKREDTAEVILREAKKIFAVLVDLELHHEISRFIEHDLLDEKLPIEETRLDEVLSSAEAKGFVFHQWEYLAYDIPRPPYQRRIRPEILLPYLEEKIVGGGGFSDVFEVSIHPAHQHIEPGSSNVGSIVRSYHLPPC